MAYDKIIDSAALDADLLSIAEVIRQKSGISETLLFPDGFINALEGLETGAGLNFGIVTYATEEALLAATPTENTIGVVTDTAVTNYIFSMTEPETPSEGLLWIKTSNMPVATVNVLMDNAIVLGLVSCSQYVSGAWIKLEAHIYQSGWTELKRYLFNRGVIYTDFTGGINGTVQDDALYVTGNIATSYNKTYTTKQTIDLTDVNTIHGRVYSPTTNTDVYMRITVTTSAATGGRVVLANLITYAGGKPPYDSPYKEYVMDVSELTGKYYLGYQWGVVSGSSTVNVTGYVYEWWVE